MDTYNSNPEGVAGNIITVMVSMIIIIAIVIPIVCMFAIPQEDDSGALSNADPEYNTLTTINGRDTQKLSYANGRLYLDDVAQNCRNGYVLMTDTFSYIMDHGTMRLCALNPNGTAMNVVVQSFTVNIENRDISTTAHYGSSTYAHEGEVEFGYIFNEDGKYTSKPSGSTAYVNSANDVAFAYCVSDGYTLGYKVYQGEHMRG